MNPRKALKISSLAMMKSLLAPLRIVREESVLYAQKHTRRRGSDPFPSGNKQGENSTHQRT